MWPLILACVYMAIVLMHLFVGRCFCILRYPAHIERFDQLFRHPGDFGAFLLGAAALPLAAVGFLRRQTFSAFVILLLAAGLLAALWPPPWV